MSSTSETWRPVLNFEGYYKVSDHGNVRSLDRDVYAGRGRTRKSLGRVLSIYRGNYSKVRLKVDGSGWTKNVHSLVAAAFIGPVPEGLEVCHNNGDPHDNRLTNLRYDTRSGNMHDRIVHGTAYSRRNQPECRNGHPWVDGSYYIDKDKGTPICLVCDRERHRQRVLRKHELNGSVPRAERIECYYGHPLDGLSNVGKRFCKTCAREATRRAYWKKKAADTG